MINTIGWIGNIALALCAVPQAWKSYSDKHSKGLSYFFLYFWLIGEILALLYHIALLGTWPQIVNFSVNILAISIMLKYKHSPKDKHGKVNFDNTECGDDSCILCESKQRESDELKDSQVAQVLHKAQTLEHPGTSVDDSGNTNESRHIRTDFKA